MLKASDHTLSLWTRDPRAMESIARKGLDVARSGRLSPETRRDLEIGLVLSLQYQRRFREARELTRSLLAAEADDPQALWCEAQLSFWMNDPWPLPWKLLEARWAMLYTGGRPVEPERIWDGSSLAGQHVLFAGERGARRSDSVCPVRTITEKSWGR